MAKTRLAAALGADGAAELARALFADAWATVGSCRWARPLLVTTEPEAVEWRGVAARERWSQGEGDLGARMARALGRALAAGAPAAIAVGTDAPALTPELLATARRALASADAVLGPSRDGGFYLIGLARSTPDLLDGLPWSSAETLTATEERLAARGFRVERLPDLADIDRPEDLAPLARALTAGEIAAPATARALARLAPTPPRISVVVPVVDEAARIERQLRALVAGGWHEVIVVDGGSADGTAELVRSVEGARLLSSPRGRGTQMNRGARTATGEVLLFLHADVGLPGDARERIAAALADPEVVAGAFRTWTVDEGRSPSWLAPLLHLGDLRSRYSGLPYGDQALFVRAAVFRRLGGYREQPLMEDLELARRLRRAGRIRTVPARVRVSGRRFLARPLYYFVLVNLMPLLYACGVPPARLARLYGDPR